MYGVLGASGWCADAWGHLKVWGVSRYPKHMGVSSQCLERSDFEHFLLWEGVEVGVVVLKEVILNSFYFGTGCGGLERTDFEQFLLWEGVVVLKELTLNSFYFGTVWWSWKKWFWIVSTLEGCGGLKRTDFEQFLLWKGVVVIERSDFEQFLLWEGVVVLKELILNSFYFGRVWR